MYGSLGGFTGSRGIESDTSCVDTPPVLSLNAAHQAARLPSPYYPSGSDGLTRAISFFILEVVFFCLLTSFNSRDFQLNNVDLASMRGFEHIKATVIQLVVHHSLKNLKVSGHTCLPTSTE